jgi:hypothetical protein
MNLLGLEVVEEGVVSYLLAFASLYFLNLERILV